MTSSPNTSEPPEPKNGYGSLKFSAQRTLGSSSFNTDEPPASEQIQMFILGGMIRMTVQQSDPTLMNAPEFDGAVQKLARFYLDNGFPRQK